MRRDRDNARRAIDASGKKAPRRTGAKPSVCGGNGAVSVRCRPIAAWLAAASLSAAACAGEKVGAITMTEVALMRRRAIRSRIAPLTAGEIP
jgi:hypothetical protein